MKKLIVVCLVLCALLTACGAKKEAKTPLSTVEVTQIVLEDLNRDAKDVQPHVHTGKLQNADVYLVYVTVDGESLTYTIEPYTGKILNITEGGHSH